MATKVDSKLDENGVPLDLIKDIRMADAIADRVNWNTFRKKLDRHLIKGEVKNG